MKLKSFFDKAKKTVDDRGGVQALKEDAEELRGVAKSEGSLADKAKGAAAAIKDPGAPGEQPPASSSGADTPPRTRP
jgi:hypothetical protein